MELHRLPAGAELIEKSPEDLRVETTAEGRIELKIERVIPPGGSIEIRYRYRLREPKPGR